MKLTWRDIILWIAAGLVVQVAGHIYEFGRIRWTLGIINFVGMVIIFCIGFFIIAAGVRAIVSIVGMDKKFDLITAIRFVCATAIVASITLIFVLWAFEPPDGWYRQRNEIAPLIEWETKKPES
jgi:hypothetical protein